MSPSSRPLPWAPAAAILALAGSLAGAVAMVVNRLVLTWDGSNYALNVIDLHRNFTGQKRSGAAVMQSLGVVFARFGASHDVSIIGLGLGYAVVPAVALGLTWLALEPEDRHLFTYAAVGILLAVLPLQAFVVTEAVIACQLSWPILVATITGLKRRGLRIAFPLVILVTVMHPASFALMLVIGAAGIGVARLRGDLREIHWLWAAGLVAMNVLRLTRLSSYEREQSSPGALVDSARVLGPAPFLVSGLAVVVVGGLLLHRHLGGRALSFLGLAVAAAGSVGSAAIAVWWAADAERWATAIEYRSMALFATLPLFVACIADVALRAWRPAAVHRTVGPIDAGAVLAAAAAFAVAMVLISESYADQHATYRARLEAAPTGCIDPQPLVPDLPAFRHWSVSEMSIVLGGERPVRVALVPEDCERVAEEGILLLPFRDPRPFDDPNGNIDVEPLLREIAGEPTRSVVRR